MKRFIIAGMVLTAGAAHAGALEYCNNNSADMRTNTSNQPFMAYRGQIFVGVGGLAPSITLPVPISQPGIIHVAFTDTTAPSNTLTCLDGGVSPSNFCGSAPPTGTISNTAWTPIPSPGSPYNPIRALAVSNTALTTLYISNSSAISQTIHYSMCQEK